jgi:lysozyme
MKLDIETLKKELRRDEGCVLHAYLDHLGFLTIGTGRLLDKRKGGGISQYEADFLLTNDINRTLGAVDAKLPWLKDLSDARQRAIVNMAFQLGINGLLEFKNMLNFLKLGKYKEAAAQALDSAWSKQTPERAKRIAELIERG